MIAASVDPVARTGAAELRAPGSRVTVWSEVDRLMLPPGTCLAGRFVIDGPPLGSGASGLVYPATDRATGRAVAAKVLHAGLDTVGLHRLQDEASIAGRLRHPNVVEVLGLWSDRSDAGGTGQWVLVSERIHGMALDDLGVVPPRAVVALGLELIEGLAAAHAAGLIHGDVRPGNVLVGPNGAALFDFGVANLGAAATPLRPGESPPERLDGGPPAAAGDVYGLGVVLYRTLHGRLPFGADRLTGGSATPWAVIGAQRTVPQVDGPRGLAALIRRMLHPDPVERPDLDTVRRALRSLRDRPERRLRVRPRVPPFRPGSPWVVYGVDPMTGAPAWIDAGLSKRQAKSMLVRLRADGWQVRGVRDAFTWKDVAWIVACALIGGAVVPVLGAVPAGWMAVRWRSEAVRPGITAALPRVTARIPPRVLSSGSETAVTVGLLLIAAAVALVWWPPVALIPAALIVVLMAWTLRTDRPAADVVARRARVQAELGRARGTIDQHAASDPDRALGLSGEADAIEAAWGAGELDADAALVRIDDLVARAGSDVGHGARDAGRRSGRDPRAAVALEALRRAHEP